MTRSPRTLTLLPLASCLLIVGFFVADPASAWYDSAWSYRKMITIDATRVENADQTDFPVMLSHTDPDLRTVANGGRVQAANGWDIVIVDGTDSVRLDHEVERFDPSTGEIVIWVEVPSLSASVDTDLFLYYGNGSVAGSLENPNGVWSNGYEAVYHLGDDFLDSTGNTRHGTNTGSTNAAAIAGDGQEFRPISQVGTGTWNVSGSALTVQAWARYPGFAQDDPRIISKALDGGPQNHVFMLSLDGVGNRFPRLRIKTGTDDAIGTTTLISSAGGLTVDTWHFIAGTYDGAMMRIFTDGVEVDSTPKTGGIRQNAWETWIGNNPNNTTDATWGATDGTLDEVRVSSIVRTADWLRTEYNNLFSPGAFYTVGTEELQGSLDLVKRAFLSDGTPVAHGATLPRGAVVKFLLYVNNPGPARADASVQDVLDPGFAYRGGTARIDTTMASCATGTCTPAEEAAVYASIDARTPETDAVDGDAVSFQSGTSTLHVGDGVDANARLDVPGGSVAAILFEVTAQ